MRKFLLLFLLLTTACGVPAAEKPTPTPTVLTVYVTPATQVWQTELFRCATTQSVVLALDDPHQADITIRLGEPESLVMPAFQLGWEEILVVVNKSRTFGQLQTEQVTGLFTGEISNWSQIDATETDDVQVWVFANGDDAQRVFATTLAGKPIASNARIATSPAEMSDALANDPNAIGILPRHWKTGNLSDVYVAASAPILAITPTEPQGAVKNLLACLQG